MNTQMLKFLVELSNYKVDAIDTNKFFAQFPKNSVTLNELKTLKNYGFINTFYAADELQEIGVNQKAIDYLK